MASDYKAFAERAKANAEDAAQRELVQQEADLQAQEEQWDVARGLYQSVFKEIAAAAEAVTDDLLFIPSGNLKPPSEPSRVNLSPNPKPLIVELSIKPRKVSAPHTHAMMYVTPGIEPVLRITVGNHEGGMARGREAALTAVQAFLEKCIADFYMKAATGQQS